MPRKRIGITLLAALLAALTVDGSSLPVKSAIATSQTLAQNADPRKAEADRLLKQGLQQYNASQFAAALQSWQQALKIYQEFKDRSGEALSLSNLGFAYRSLGQYQKAIEFYQQSLAIAKQIGNRSGEAASLNNLGNAYYSLGQYQKAIDFHQQSLAIAKQIGDRSGEGISLNNLGSLLAQQKQPELAIVFYKQSVNVREGIRHDIRGLDKELRQSYTDTIADTYRSLADLLLAQGRILEAQQVLELLKVEEIRTFTRNRDAGGKTDGIATNPSETKVLNSHGSLIALGLQVEKCQQEKCTQLGQLNDRREVVTQEFNATVRSLEKEIRSRLAKDDAFFDPRKIQGKAEAIVSAQPGTVLIYPLVLKDKVWILWASKGGITKSIEIPNMGQEQLGKLILELRGELNREGSPEDLVNLKATSKKIYDVLIPPSLRAELKANNIQNLVF
jgi:tetratricopeptide (TPR) repeat protein